MSSTTMLPNFQVSDGEEDGSAFLSPTSRDDLGESNDLVMDGGTREPRVNVANASGSSPQDGTAVAGAVSVQISNRMPHPYDGTTDFRAWLRRYETAADAAQWSEVARASRLGMYLEDDYFDSWEQLADKKDWSVDKALMLSLFAKRSPDEALRAFSTLQWDGQQKFVVFAARLIRYLKEYNRSLPEGQRMSSESMTRQVFDRCVDVAPEGAQQELRKQTDHSIQAICSIVDDYNPGTAPTRTSRPVTKAPLAAEAHPALPTIVEAVKAAMAPLLESLAGSIQRPSPPQGQNRYYGNRRGPRGGRNGGCGNCGGPHSALECRTLSVLLRPSALVVSSAVSKAIWLGTALLVLQKNE